MNSYKKKEICRENLEKEKNKNIALKIHLDLENHQIKTIDKYLLTTNLATLSQGMKYSFDSLTPSLATLSQGMKYSFDSLTPSLVTLSQAMKYSFDSLTLSLVTLSQGMKYSFDSLTPSLVTLSQGMKYSFDSLMPSLATLSQGMKYSFNSLELAFKSIRFTMEMLENFDYNEFIKVYTDNIVKNNTEVLNLFKEKNIFPPIFYVDKNLKIKLNSVDLNNKDLKEFYLKIMKRWIKKNYEFNVKDMINEIIDNYNKNNIYSTTITLFTLLEYRINIAKLNIGKREPIFPRYKTILEEQAFDKENTKKELIYYIHDVIFKNTEKATSLTRHIVHGKNLNLITYDGMMSLIFFYDFIDNLLKIENI